MIYLGGGTSAGMVAVSMPVSGAVEMDKSQIGITPNLVLDASGVPQVSAAVSIPSGTLSQNYNTTSGAVSFSNKVTTKTITENGTYGPENGQIFNKVIVSVAGSSSGTVKAQAVTATPNSATQTITPEAGYDYLSSVTVNPVPLDSRNGQTFRSNVTVTAADGKWFKSFTIAVPNSGGGSGTSNIQISKTTNIDNAVSSNPGSISVEPDSGYDSMAQVVIDTSNLYVITDQEQANEYILSGVRGYQISEAHGAHALRPVQGSMTNHEAASATLNHTTKSYTIGKGYHNGLGSVMLGSNSSTPNITINGTVVTYDDNGNYYDSIIVNVPVGSTINLQENKSISPTGNTFATGNSYSVLPDTNYQGMAQVTIDTSKLYFCDTDLVATSELANLVVQGTEFYIHEDTSDNRVIKHGMGAMPNNQNITGQITEQGGVYTIPMGYHDGTGTVTANISTEYNTYYVGTIVPTSNLGSDGDIYLYLKSG